MIYRNFLWKMQDDIPDNIRSILDNCLCPITYELPYDPVMCIDGHTYERSAIMVWLEKHDTSPVNPDIKLVTRPGSNITCGGVLPYNVNWVVKKILNDIYDNYKISFYLYNKKIERLIKGIPISIVLSLYFTDKITFEYTGELNNKGESHGKGEEISLVIDNQVYQKIKYSGYYTNNIWNIKGKIEWPDDSIYEGELLQGLYHGKGVLISGNNDDTYEGQFKNGLKYGQGERRLAKIRCPSYLKYTNNPGFLKGKTIFILIDNIYYEAVVTKLDRLYILRLENCSIPIKISLNEAMFYIKDQYNILNASSIKLVSGMWNNEKLHGYCNCEWYNGNRYWGDMEYNVMKGYGSMRYNNGDIYIGKWMNNMYNGKGYYESNRNNLIIVGNFKNGFLCGFGLVQYNGSIIYGRWLNSKLVGDGYYKARNGVIISGTFKNSILINGSITDINNETTIGQRVVKQNNYTKIDKLIYLNHSLSIQRNINIDMGLLLNPLKYFECINSQLNYLLTGTVITISKEGITYIDKYRNGIKLTGKYSIGIEINRNNDIYMGQWKDNNKHGHGILIKKKEGIKYEGKFRNNKMYIDKTIKSNMDDLPHNKMLASEFIKHLGSLF